MQQKTYTVEEHGLDIQKVDPDALYVMEKLRSAGFIAYLVGGGVRDLLLKKTPKDYDISTSAKPEEIKRLFRNCILIGRRFRLAHVRFGNKVIEVSTFRAGDNETDELIVRDNVWGTPEQDVLRRDFTINGLFYDSSNQTIIDYVEGYPDIQKKHLRTIGQPYLRFKQDPVRMIRCLKFRARFGLDIDHDTRLALLDCRAEIIKSSPSRVLEELLRMLESGAAASFFKLMNEHHLLQLLLPSLSSFMETVNGDEILAYLQEADELHQDPRQTPLDRSLLLSCLTYPLFQKHIQTGFIDRQRVPHLGEIQNEAHRVIEETFRTFFLLPRRLRFGMASILTGQYRLTPIEKKRHFRLRPSHDPDFPLAVRFLELRTQLEPGLQQTWEQWKEICGDPAPSRPSSRPRHKRRRRKRPSDGQAADV